MFGGERDDPLTRSWEGLKKQTIMVTFENTGMIND